MTKEQICEEYKSGKRFVAEAVILLMEHCDLTRLEAEAMVESWWEPGMEGDGQ